MKLYLNEGEIMCNALLYRNMFDAFVLSWYSVVYFWKENKTYHYYLILPDNNCELFHVKVEVNYVQ